ncbi:acido-empty-quinoprotein group A [Bryobacter aggregatus]|uniref:acido-empty-quinoprotein group A n=1 Tax=Bryobacter aggregatus TaxID=360054 RepID=UPI0004E23AEA|nr:acido-empty-quinoprotein group A [Bryobacter aggregatus]
MKFLAVFSLAATLAAQSLDPALLLKPLSNDWPTYSGDYSGKRYSALTQINQANVKNLSLAWVTRMTAGMGAPGGGFGRFGAAAVPTIVGGEGSAELAASFGNNVNIRASMLVVDGKIYFSTPDNAWAVDARDGRVIWHYFWKTKGGTHIGNRGLGMWGKWLYMETPDDYLVSLDAATGKERWHKQIADFNQQYFSTMAPIVVGNHIIIGTGNDLDAPGFVQARDPETGDVQWTSYTVPMKKGDPGLETWGTLEGARVGAGNVWIPGSYDPETKLYIFGTGNPSPSYTNPKSRDGDNLYTCSLVALNVETGKMAWYYQLNPHDTHDWDSSETPILVDGEFKGKPRKMALHADRNGYFYVVDRTNGEHLLTSKFSDTANWVKEINAKGQTIRDVKKDSTVPGSLVSPNNYGATNWPPAAYSPDTGLFYVPQSDTYAMYYLTETDPRGAMGLGGKDEQMVASMGSYLTAIDYKTGKIAWRHRYPGVGGAGGGNGILTTASKLVFAGDVSGNLVSYDATNGKILWHARLGNITNAPQTYMLDGKQYLLVAAGDSVYAFYLQ